MRFFWSTHLLMFLSLETFNVYHKDWFTYSGGTDGPGELCYNFSISNYLTQMVNFPVRIPDCDSHSPALLDLFLSSDAHICSTMGFPPLGNSDHVVVSVSINFSSNSQWDALFHCISYDCFHADCDGLCDHLRDVPWEDIFKLLVLLLLLVNFVSGFGLESMYISLIENINSSLIHLHGFHRNDFFCLHQNDKSSDSKVKFRQARSFWKRVLEAAKLASANKTKEYITSQKLGSSDFWRIANSILLYLLYSTTGRCCLLHLIK